MNTTDVVSHEEALRKLLDGNARYQAGTNCSLNPCPTTISLDAGQSPFAAFIRCADSRVAPEIVFDQPLGSLFVCGVAGNIPTIEIVASLEYAVCVLETKLIVIMGHSSCGAVTAALEDERTRSELPGHLPGLIERIHGNIEDLPTNSETMLDDADCRQCKMCSRSTPADVGCHQEDGRSRGRPGDRRRRRSQIRTLRSRQACPHESMKSLSLNETRVQ